MLAESLFTIDWYAACGIRRKSWSQRTSGVKSANLAGEREGAPRVLPPFLPADALKHWLDILCSH